MNVLGLLAVLVLAVGGLLVAGVLQPRLIEGTLEIEARSGERTHQISLDFREGLLGDACLLGLVWLTATLVVGSSWVAGSEVLVPTSVAAFGVCLLIAKLAPRGTTYWLAAEVAAVAALFVFTAGHTANPVADVVSWVRTVRGSVADAVLVTMVGSGWMAVAWAVFWVARKRNATVALVPMAVALAVEIINDPGQTSSGGITVIWILVAAVLLLRLHTARIRDRWRERADSQVWIFIASRGALVVVALLVIAVLVPPLNSIDLSVGLFHGRDAGAGPGTGDGTGVRAPILGSDLTVTGYSEHVSPGGTLTRSSSVVMQVTSDFTRPVYWRGINLYDLSNGAWSRGPAGRVSTEVGANTNLDTGSENSRQVVHGTIEVLGVPQQTIFWPGEPVRADQATLLRSDAFGIGTFAVEGAYATAALRPGSKYTVQAADTLATEDDLRQAGSVYPADILRRTSLLAAGVPRPGTVGLEVSDLTRRVAVGASFYDQVKSIETYLRTQERYQLKINPPPAGTDPVSYFLLTSHVGYCEYFASAMGEMVRSLGVPVRLVSGYGPGSATSKADVGVNFVHEVNSGLTVNTIRASDAHTWVEVYFPTYGWVPFEPTPDPAYPTLTRGVAAPRLVTAAAPAPAVPAVAAPATGPGRQPGRSAVPTAIGLAFALVLALVLLLMLAGRVARGPGRGANLGLAWRRLGWLGTRLGVPRRESDTPLEFSTRLAQRLPELDVAIMTLGRAYSRTLYGAGAQGTTEGEEAAWRKVRSRLVRVLALGGRATRVRPGASAPQS